MNLRITFFMTVLLSCILFVSCQQRNDSPQKGVSKASLDQKANTELIVGEESKERLLRHMVIFKFKEGAGDEDVKKLNNSFNALADAIPVVKDFEWGINDSPENFHQDFTHCYLLTFDSEEDRDSIYSPHPQHQAFVKSLQPHLEKVFVVDYWTNP